jgi:hypothetical protein
LISKAIGVDAIKESSSFAESSDFPFPVHAGIITAITAISAKPDKKLAFIMKNALMIDNI